MGGEVKVRWFDPRTGVPCESRPEPLRRERPPRETAADRDRRARRERMRAEAEGAAIYERMHAERRGPVGGQPPRPCEVDGVRFASIKEASRGTGVPYSTLRCAIRDGRKTAKGHSVAWKEER